MQKEKIIVALDVETAAEAREISAELRGEVGAFKIGLQLFTAAGASFVRKAVEAGDKIFLDLKFHDIPNTVAKAAVEAARLGVWMFNVHAVGGSEMMRRTVGEVGEICEKETLEHPQIIGVTVLTSADQYALTEVGIESETDAQVLKLARLAAECGLDGVVASPLEIALIRQNVLNKDFLIVTPGIRSGKVETFDDQKRVTTAKDALDAGANYLVIGRPIVRSENRVSAVRQILEETAKRLKF